VHRGRYLLDFMLLQVSSAAAASWPLEPATWLMVFWKRSAMRSKAWLMRPSSSVLRSLARLVRSPSASRVLASSSRVTEALIP